MKTLKILFIAFMGVALMTACEKSNDVEDLQQSETTVEILGNDDAGLNFRGKKGKPFKANFHTIRTYIVDPNYCTEAPFLDYNYQAGEGNATHLGKFSTTMYFCSDPSNIPFKVDYKNGEGVFVAANGDELYIKIPIGVVLPYNHPVYELQFHDEFIFCGGTGRFEGATGGGVTESYVDLLDDEGNLIPDHRTDHKWTGALILP